MSRIDYGQVPEIKNPSFKDMVLVRGGPSKKQCKNLKYIKNQFINSPNRSYDGVSLVGQHNETGHWRLLRVWRKR